jgi:hypothetical protein
MAKRLHGAASVDSDEQSGLLPDPIQTSIMAVKKLSNAVRTARNVKRKLARDVNKLDKAMGGMVLGNPYSGAVVPYLNAAGAAVDYFDSMLSTFGATDHPQIAAGSVAGVSQTIPVSRTKPRILSSKGNIRIMHKELISEVTMVPGIATNPTTSGGRSVYTVSPANPTLFPWLATIASSYDYFKFNRLKLVYVPLCSTTTTGRVMLGFDPDASDAIAYDRQGLSSYYCSSDSSAWGVSSLECALPTNQPWFQTNSITNSASYSTSAQGQVFWATWSGAAAAPVGELYVLYDVTLKDPQPSSIQLFRANGNATSITSNFSVEDPVVISTVTANSVSHLFTGTGTYNVTFVAETTGASEALDVSLSGNISDSYGGSPTFKVGDGTNGLMSFQVTVTNVGYSTAPGVVSAPAVVTVVGLTGLGLWSSNVTKCEKVVHFPGI